MTMVKNIKVYKYHDDFAYRSKPYLKQRPLFNVCGAVLAQVRHSCIRDMREAHLAVSGDDGGLVISRRGEKFATAQIYEAQITRFRRYRCTAR